MPYIPVILIDPDRNEYSVDIDSNADEQLLLSSILRKLGKDTDGRKYKLTLISGLKLQEGSVIELCEETINDPIGSYHLISKNR